MQKLFILFFIVLLFVSCAHEKEPVQPDEIAIIPKPGSIKPGDNHLFLQESITLAAVTDDEKLVADYLIEFFGTKRIKAINQTEQGKDLSITLKIQTDAEVKPEGYTLTVDDRGVLLQASTSAGLFYAAQSLIQLVSPDGKKIPYVSIDDAPRFSYRGLHLDVGRHMFPIAFIKKYIDLLARHKFNRFHWHLTEDQGWRIEIKKYPKLQEIAAFRNETVIGHARTADRNNAKSYDGQRYGGFYTQDEIKEVIQYAAKRHVTIIPEIELPGHALAALAAYPDLGCTGGPYKAATTWGVFDDVFCAGKEDTFIFLQGVLDEVIELFPSEYIHIGGDECPKTRWEKCPHCKKRMKAENIKDTHALQSYFIQRIEKYVNSKGKKIIGWDEILEGGLAPNATVMSWRGEEGGIAAAQQNHDVIMTPTGWCYFDYYQDTTKTEPLAIGGYLPISKVYSYEPQPVKLTAEQAKHILGVQANVWTEYMKTSDYVEYMVYPRACAMAEVAWSSKENRNYEDFIKRLQKHAIRLDEWKVNYAKHVIEAAENTPVNAASN